MTSKTIRKLTAIQVEALRDEVNAKLSYDRGTGHWQWTDAPCVPLHLAGKKAGGKDKEGNITITLGGKTYFARRLAWLVAHNEWPQWRVVHIDRDKSNVALDNLRLFIPWGSEAAPTVATQVTDKE